MSCYFHLHNATLAKNCELEAVLQTTEASLCHTQQLDMSGATKTGKNFMTIDKQVFY